MALRRYSFALVIMLALFARAAMPCLMHVQAALAGDGHAHHAPMQQEAVLAAAAGVLCHPLEPQPQQPDPTHHKTELQCICCVVKGCTAGILAQTPVAPLPTLPTLARLQPSAIPVQQVLTVAWPAHRPRAPPHTIISL